VYATAARYTGAPLASLQRLDRRYRNLRRTLSKVLIPGLRLGQVVA
jgi:DNA-binding transcriptional MocR family regulator